MKLTSSAFTHENMIPSKYTCDEANISPSLSWEGAPAETKSFALVVEDPDAPMMTFIHWVVYNIPPAETQLQEGILPTEQLSNGAIQGKNSFQKIGYGGPCPPAGTHRYYFKLYALDRMLDNRPGVKANDLTAAMKGHILAEAELMGRYRRNK